jgi:hypothetical protein
MTNTIVHPFFPVWMKLRKIFPLSFLAISSTLPNILILTQDTISEGNLGNISHMITIDDISIKEGIVENIQLGANCSAEEVETYTALFK